MEKTLGELIQDALIKRGWTNAELARRSGFSATYIGNLIRDYAPGTKSGKPTRLPAETVDKLADALGESQSTFRKAAGLLPNGSDAEPVATEIIDRAAEAARAAELIKDFLTMTPEQQTRALVVLKALQAEHPDLIEMLKPPIEIIDEADLLKQRPDTDVEPVDT